MSERYEKYYVPAQSPWPIVGAIGLFCIAFGAGGYVNDVTKGVSGYSGYLLLAGIATIIFMLVGWFRNVIDESMSGMYSAQMDRSFKQGMSWFIFSEVMFFGAFFGALLYARVFSVPWLGGASNNAMTIHMKIWLRLNVLGYLSTSKVYHHCISAWSSSKNNSLSRSIR